MKYLFCLLGISASTLGWAAGTNYTCFAESSYTAKIFNQTEGTLAYTLSVSGAHAEFIRNQDGRCWEAKRNSDGSFRVSSGATARCGKRLLPKLPIELLRLVDGTSKSYRNLAVMERFGNGPSDLRMHSFMCTVLDN